MYIYDLLIYTYCCLSAVPTAFVRSVRSTQRGNQGFHPRGWHFLLRSSQLERAYICLYCNTCIMNADIYIYIHIIYTYNIYIHIRLYCHTYIYIQIDAYGPFSVSIFIYWRVDHFIHPYLERSAVNLTVDEYMYMYM